jgi:hypothetical protein
MATVTMALCPLAAPGQEFAIKFAKPGPGEAFQVKKESEADANIRALNGDNQAVFEKKEIKTHTYAFREVGIERAQGGGDLVKLKRTYKKAQRTIDGDRRALIYQGETVLIEKKEGGHSFKIEGGEALEGEDAKELAEEFNKGDMSKLLEAFQPRKTVKVDDTWTFDVAMLAKEFAKDGKIVIDPAKSTGSGKLLKAYQKNGKQFGVVELTITLAVSHFDHDGNKAPTKDSKIVIKLERDGAIDGSMDATQLKVAFDGDIRAAINANGMDLTLEITIRAKVEEQRSLAAK